MDKTSIPIRIKAVPAQMNWRVKSIKKHWQLYLIMIIPVAYIVLFHYFPMYGVTLAFKDYSVTKGILGSPWAGTKYFEMFFKSPSFWRLIQNTLIISLYSLVAGFSFPIILAIMINEIRARAFKKTVQMVTYAPFFISTIVMVALLMQWLNPRFGLVNLIIGALGFDHVDFMAKTDYFRHIYVWSGVWQFTGFNSIIYIAALSAIDQEQYEAALIDGASRLQRIRHIDLPGISSTIIILLIMSAGSIMNVGFEKVFAMQNNLNTPVSEVISTYVYKIGLINMNFSFSTAVGLFNSIINLIMLLTVNAISSRISNTSLFQIRRNAA